MIESFQTAFSTWMFRIAVCGLVALGLWLAVSGICRLLKKKLRQVAGAGVLAILMCATVLSAAMTNNFTTLEEKEELRALQSQEQSELQVLAGLLVPQEDQLRCGGTLPNLLGSVAESKTFPHWAHGIYEDGQRVCFDSDWVFPYGTDHLVSVEVQSGGAILPDGFAAEPIAAFATHLSLVPGVSAFHYGRTPSNSYEFVWTDARDGRIGGAPFSGRIELFRNGDVAIDANGSAALLPRTLPFAHDGFGQDAAWVEANFARPQALSPSLTNAAEILSVGYANWVDAQVGIDLTNGLYKFTATFTEAPPEATLLTVGDNSVAVTNAGDYTFILGKGTEYEFETIPYDDTVDYRIQDDLLDEAEPMMLMSWWGGSESPGEWTTDGGWHWLYYPMFGYPGQCTWMPTLQGSPDVAHLGLDDQGTVFEAVLSDCVGSAEPTFTWTASSEDVHFTSPNARTTGLTFDSFPSWSTLGLTVQANLGGYSLWSSLYPSYGTNDTPQIHLALSVPEGLSAGGSRRKLTAVFDSDIETNGCIVLLCTRGQDKIEIWSAPSNGVSVASSNSWQVAKSHICTCYLHGKEKSDLEGVEFEYKFMPDGGSDQVVTAKSTVFECYTQPIDNNHYSGLNVINPSFLNPQSNAVFRVTVDPADIPPSRIQWSASSGSATFPNGNTGTEVKVLGVSGLVDIEINVLGATDERMYFKTKVH